MIDRSLFMIPGVGKALGIMLVISLAQAGCIIGQAVALSSAITNLWEGAALAEQATLVLRFFALFAAHHVLGFGRSAFLDRFAATRADELREHLLARVFDTHSPLVSQTGTAGITTSALEGIDQVETYLKVILPKMVGVIAIPLVTLVAVFVLDIVSGIILLVMYPVIIFFMILLGNQAKAQAEEQYATYQTMSNHFVDTLRGIDTLKVFGASKGYGATIYRVSERFRQATIRTLQVATLSSAVLDLISTGGMAGVSIMLAFRLLDGSVGLFAGLAVLVLSPEYFRPIREFAGDFHASLDGKNALAAINRIIGETPGQSGPAPKIAQWNAHSHLALSNVGYSYPAQTFDADAGHDDALADADAGHNDALADAAADGSPASTADGVSDAGGAGTTGFRRALQDITLDLHGFEKVGIVGVSGSGKTTLVNLLAGFARNTEGAITLDGTHVETLSTPGWISQLHYIPQNPYVFHATLHDNIAFYAPDASEERVRHAVETVGLDSFVAKLDDGLDTLVGEGARGLSGGQAHRIALARALLDERAILLFDEPTAHLDIETELELKERMLPLMDNRLVVFATHRLHWLAAMDRIVVMEDGRIAEQGTLDELMAAGGALPRLVSRMRGGDAA